MLSVGLKNALNWTDQIDSTMMVFYYDRLSDLTVLQNRCLNVIFRSGRILRSFLSVLSLLRVCVRIEIGSELNVYRTTIIMDNSVILSTTKGRFMLFYWLIIDRVQLITALYLFITRPTNQRR